MNNTFPLILFVCEQIKKYVCFIVKLYEINKTKKKLFIYIHFRILMNILWQRIDTFRS